MPDWNPIVLSNITAGQLIGVIGMLFVLLAFFLLFWKALVPKKR